MASSLSEDDCKRYLRLEPVEQPPQVKSVIPPLNLTSKEMAALEKMIASWSLYSGICLLDLWGVDLFKVFKQLADVLPSTSDLQMKFCGKFIQGYISLYALNSDENFKDLNLLEFHERGSPKKEGAFAISINEWIYTLQEIRKDLQRKRESRSGNKESKLLLRELEDKLFLGEKLLSDPNGKDYLRGYTLCGLKEVFPCISKLEENEPKKTVEDLLLFTEFFATAHQAAMEKRYIGVENAILSVVHQRLAKVAKGKGKLKASKLVRSCLADALIIFKVKKDESLVCCGSVLEGTLTLEDYAKEKGFQVGGGLSQKEFAAKLLIDHLAYTLFSAFTLEIFDIFDGYLMGKFFPEDYVTVEQSSIRFQINLDYLKLNSLLIKAPPQLIHRSVEPLSEKDLGALFQLEQALWFNIEQIRIGLTVDLLPFFHEVPRTRAEVQQNGCNNIQDWQPLVQLFYRKPIDDCLLKLEWIRTGFLGSIENFLLTLNQEELRKNRIAWEMLFREICFLYSSDLFRFMMLFQDSQAMLKLDGEISRDEELIPDQLVDFMELEGIDQLLDKLTHVPEPTPVMIPQEIPEAPIVLSPQTIVEPTKPAEELFKIRRGEKVRKILSRLRSIGIIPSRDKRGGTSHLKLQDNEGRTRAVIPVGGNHVVLKLGTAKSFGKQLAQQDISEKKR